MRIHKANNQRFSEGVRVVDRGERGKNENQMSDKKITPSAPNGLREVIARAERMSAGSWRVSDADMDRLRDAADALQSPTKGKTMIDFEQWEKANPWRGTSLYECRKHTWEAATSVLRATLDALEAGEIPATIAQYQTELEQLRCAAVEAVIPLRALLMAEANHPVLSPLSIEEIKKGIRAVDEAIAPTAGEVIEERDDDETNSPHLQLYQRP